MGLWFAWTSWGRYRPFPEADTVGADELRDAQTAIKRNGTVQLLAAFAPHCGHGVGQAVPRKTGEAILEFLQTIVLPEFPHAVIYLIWDNLSAHKKALRLWEPKPERVRFAWIPTNASWLNLIEAWFSVLERTALHNTYLRTPTEIEASLQRGIAYLNEHPKPYRWTKTI